MKTERSIVIYVMLVILSTFFLPLNVSARNWKTGGVANPDTLEHRTLEKWTAAHIGICSIMLSGAFKKAAFCH